MGRPCVRRAGTYVDGHWRADGWYVECRDPEGRPVTVHEETYATQLSAYYAARLHAVIDLCPSRSAGPEVTGYGYRGSSAEACAGDAAASHPHPGE